MKRRNRQENNKYSKHCFIRFRALLFSILLGISAFFPLSMVSVHAVTSFTAEGITETTGSITMTVDKDEWYIDGAKFRLYQVATLNDDLSFTPSLAFKATIDNSDDLNTMIQSKNASEWMKASDDLIQAVEENDIQEDQAIAIHNRTVTFNNLSLGLYLIQGDTAKEGNRTVTYQPVLICIPQRDSNLENWQYNITSHVKMADPEYEYPDTPTPVPSSTPAPTPAGETETGITDTGDHTNVTFYATVMLVDAALIAAIIFIRKKKTDNEES